MASAPSMSKYKKTGFYTATNVAELQKQLATYAPKTDAEYASRAESYYSPTFNQQKQQYQNQFSELRTSRDMDVKKINSQYDKNLSGIMTGLNARGLGRSSLVSTRGVENENARNGAVADASYNYLKQENAINANIQQLEAEYAQNIETKAQEMKRQDQSDYIALMTQIAQLQQSGYSAYANYLLNK